jgi:penicillin amidase
MKVFKWIIGNLCGLILVILIGVYVYLRSSLPDYNGEITAAGIIKPVDINRDSYAMPHIYAQTDEDTYFAPGYCMAQDRLFHMDLMRRVIPAGISGNFKSPHYDNQAEPWRTGKYRPFVLDRKSIQADARYTLKMLAG